MHGKSRLSSAIKYDCLSWKTLGIGHGCIVFDLKRDLG